MYQLLCILYGDRMSGRASLNVQQDAAWPPPGLCGPARGGALKQDSQAEVLNQVFLAALCCLIVPTITV